MIQYYTLAILGWYFLVGGVIGLHVKGVDVKTAWPAVFGGGFLIFLANVVC